MLMSEYDYEMDIEVQREEAFEEGQKVGEQRGREIGKRIGEKIGEEYAQKRFATLTTKLVEAGRAEEVIKAAQDMELCEKLYREYKID